MKKINKGFTLIELLVVIAIIGILSSIAIVNLNSARQKAKDAQVKGSLNALVPGILLCYDNDPVGELNCGAAACGAAGTPVENTALCTGATNATIGTWPKVANGWVYITNSGAGSSALGTFSFGACKGTDATCAATAGTDTKYTCSQDGCKETTF